MGRKKTRVFPVRVSPEDHSRLKDLSKSRGRPVSELIRENLLSGSTSPDPRSRGPHQVLFETLYTPPPRPEGGPSVILPMRGEEKPDTLVQVFHIDDLTVDDLRRNTGALRK